MRNVRVLDLFCGCGGFSFGLTEAGMNVMLGVDIWDKAIESYTKNMTHIGNAVACRFAYHLGKHLTSLLAHSS